MSKERWEKKVVQILSKICLGPGLGVRPIAARRFRCSRFETVSAPPHHQGQPQGPAVLPGERERGQSLTAALQRLPQVAFTFKWAVSPTGVTTSSDSCCWFWYCHCYMTRRPSMEDDVSGTLKELSAFPASRSTDLLYFQHRDGASHGQISSASTACLSPDCSVGTHFTRTLPPTAQKQNIFRWTVHFWRENLVIVIAVMQV